MIKAVFLDYTGTIQQYKGDDKEEIEGWFLNESAVNTPGESAEWWKKTMHRLQDENSGDSYRPLEDLAVELLGQAKMELRMKGDPQELCKVLQNYWMYAPVYDDAREFLDLCSLPVYVISDVGRSYIRICLQRNRMHVNGIISSEDSRTYAPHMEFYEKALEKAECQAENAVYVSDDYDHCIQGAQKAGLQAVLLDRKSRHRDLDTRRVRNLIEILPLISAHNEREK